ncbi:Farnesyl pyrophosphate synthetase, partial [Dispira parvispora]
IGTDIEDNKCSWLINQALLIANQEQLAMLTRHYGKRTPEDVAAVKAVYQDLQIDRLFHEYETESYKHINQMIQESDNGLVPHQIFRDFMAKVYKRTK